MDARSPQGLKPSAEWRLMDRIDLSPFSILACQPFFSRLATSRDRLLKRTDSKPDRRAFRLIGIVCDNDVMSVPCGSEIASAKGETGKSDEVGTNFFCLSCQCRTMRSTVKLYVYHENDFYVFHSPVVGNRG